jgi:hypothetical protein
VSDRK